MTANFSLRLYADDAFVAETVCTALSLIREVYTPYDELSAVFLSNGADYGNVNSVAVFWNDMQIFLGITDSVVQFRKNGVTFVKVQSKSFTSMMLQNEMEKGLIANLTLDQLVNGYYRIPFVTHEPSDVTGYINIKDNTTLWDCIVCFGYKLKRHYPFVKGNEICISPPESDVIHSVEERQVLESGTAVNTSRLVSHYHMESFFGEPNGYFLENPAAQNANIVRHKQITFDRQFLHDPDDALVYRARYSQKACNARYVVYEGFRNEMLGERISYGSFLQGQIICRVHVSFSQKGLRTGIWAYQDGFYNQK